MLNIVGKIKINEPKIFFAKKGGTKVELSKKERPIIFDKSLILLVSAEGFEPSAT